MISPKVAKELNLKPVGLMNITGANDKEEPAPTYIIDLCVGELEYKNRITAAQYGNEDSDPIVILGNNFLKYYDLIMMHTNGDILLSLQLPKE